MAHDLIDTTEMYLKTVFELLELGVTPMRARIAERLGQSGPTVSQTVARMERDGLLFLDDDRVIHLSIEGERIATEVMRKHRLAERHLIDVIGMEYAQVHEEACRWEHVMSTEVEKKIAALIAPPFVDPYGNPIPGLSNLGIDLNNSKETVENETAATGVSEIASERGVRLAEVEIGSEPLHATVVSIGEVIQSDVPFLSELAGQGVIPGASVVIERDADSFLIGGTGAGRVPLSPVDAGHIRVSTRPSARPASKDSTKS